jgi:hypothetical protein
MIVDTDEMTKCMRTGLISETVTKVAKSCAIKGNNIRRKSLTLLYLLTAFLGCHFATLFFLISTLFSTTQQEYLQERKKF